MKCVYQQSAAPLILVTIIFILAEVRLWTAEP
jgi:hypothetical protein